MSHSEVGEWKMQEINFMYINAVVRASFPQGDGRNLPSSSSSLTFSSFQSSISRTYNLYLFPAWTCFSVALLNPSLSYFSHLSSPGPPESCRELMVGPSHLCQRNWSPCPSRPLRSAEPQGCQHLLSGPQLPLCLWPHISYPSLSLTTYFAISPPAL